MVYYLGLIGVIGILRLLNLRWENIIPRKLFFILAALCVILFQGFRSFSVGTDLEAYLPAYLEIGQAPWGTAHLGFEWGYLILNKLLYTIGCSRRVFLIVVAAMIQIPIFLTLYRQSEKPFLSILVYFAFGNFIMTFSGLRQSIAMGLCFAAYNFIKSKKPVPFLLLIAFATLFHKSAVFCVLLFPLYYLHLWEVPLPLQLSGVGFCFFFRKDFVEWFGKLYYGHEVEVTDNHAYTMFFMYLLLYVVAYILERRGDPVNPESPEDRDYLGLRNILFLLIVAFSLASAHDYIARIAFPLTLYLSVFVPKLLDRIPGGERIRLSARIASYVLCVACFCYFAGGLNTLPFRFF